MAQSPNLASPAVIAALLKRHGIRPNRRWGQNFLADANLLGKVTDAAELTPADAVLEVGPGLGGLTRAVAAVAGRVLAVEVDPALAGVLRAETVSDLENVRILRADFLSLDLPHVLPESLGSPPYVVVANIPYSITTPLIGRLLEHAGLFSRAVLMVQREVAERITAAPGTSDYGSLTLYVNLYAQAKRIALVSKKAFVPAPEVDSAIIRLDLRPSALFPETTPSRYLSVVHASFQQRRKNLGNSLTGPPLNWTREQAQKALYEAGIDPNRRGETLSPEEFARIAMEFPQETP